MNEDKQEIPLDYDNLNWMNISLSIKDLENDFLL